MIGKGNTCASGDEASGEIPDIYFSNTGHSPAELKGIK